MNRKKDNLIYRIFSKKKNLIPFLITIILCSSFVSSYYFFQPLFMKHITDEGLLQKNAPLDETRVSVCQTKDSRSFIPSISFCFLMPSTDSSPWQERPATDDIPGCSASAAAAPSPFPLLLLPAGRRYPPVSLPN